ncbi:MAG TPA: hypothetical protein VM677_27780 [Actinokineospora sp.]|jgi:hypothetical protein|nr:hypothetical protein [Actinokineospora sp.]
MLDTVVVNPRTYRPTTWDRRRQATPNLVVSPIGSCRAWHNVGRRANGTDKFGAIAPYRERGRVDQKESAVNRFASDAEGHDCLGEFRSRGLKREPVQRRRGVVINPGPEAAQLIHRQRETLADGLGQPLDRHALPVRSPRSTEFGHFRECDTRVSHQDSGSEEFVNRRSHVFSTGATRQRVE